MERLTFDGNFCDIALCSEVRYGSFCEDGSCSQRRVWERLKSIEDILGGDYNLDRLRELVEASPFRGAIYPGATVYCICEDFPRFYPKTGGWYISEETVGAVGVGRFYVGDPSDDTIFEESEIGKTAFLTREEAEAALEEG